MSQITNHKSQITRAFTLVELLVVMAIIGVLASLAVTSFRSAQARGRDAQRKSDLKQISNSLELFYNDYGRYPAAVGTTIGGCSYNPATGTGSSCAWGTGTFTDGRTTYFRNMPIDPSAGSSYTYRVVPLSNNQKFQLFATLENIRDSDCINAICTTNPNFAITSANTNASE